MIPPSTTLSIASSSPKTKTAATLKPTSWPATRSTTSPRPGLATPSVLSAVMATLCPPLKLSLVAATATTGATIAAVATHATEVVAAAAVGATCAVATVVAADVLVPAVARLVGDVG